MTEAIKRTVSVGDTSRPPNTTTSTSHNGFGNHEHVTACDMNVTGKKCEFVTVTFAMYVGYFRQEPDRKFTALDFVQRFHVKPSAVRQALSRLAKTGKGGGPVRRLAPGIYQYDPTKEDTSLQAVLRFDNCKFENLLFVTKRAQGVVGSHANLNPDPEKSVGCDIESSSIPAQCANRVNHPNFPSQWKLDSGHLITWEDDPNGTQMIRISANGAPPISPDHLLTIIGIIKQYGGLDDSWTCKSLEINSDSRALRIDASYSIQLIEDVTLKIYQHDYVGRIEIADRRTVSMQETMDFIHAVTNNFDGQGIIRENRIFEKRIKEMTIQSDRRADHAYKTADKVRDDLCELKNQISQTGKTVPK